MSTITIKDLKVDTTLERAMMSEIHGGMRHDPTDNSISFPNVAQVSDINRLALAPPPPPPPPIKLDQGKW